MSATLKFPKISSHPEIQERIDAYNRLSDLHQAIVHILAIIYSPTARTNILNSLKKLYDGDAAIKRFKVCDLDPILDHLAEQGLVEQAEMYFECQPFLKETICRLLVDNDRFGDVAVAVQQAIPISPIRFGIYSFPNYDLMFREIRISIYLGDVGDADQGPAGGSRCNRVAW